MQNVRQMWVALTMVSRKSETNISSVEKNDKYHVCALTMVSCWRGGQVLTAFTAIPRDLLVLKDKEN